MFKGIYFLQYTLKLEIKCINMLYKDAVTIGY